MGKCTIKNRKDLKLRQRRKSKTKPLNQNKEIKTTKSNVEKYKNYRLYSTHLMLASSVYQKWKPRLQERSVGAHWLIPKFQGKQPSEKWEETSWFYVYALRERHFWKLQMHRETLQCHDSFQNKTHTWVRSKSLGRWYINTSIMFLDRLCGLVVRVPGYRSRGPGFDSRRYQIFWETVGLEQGPLSLVRIIEELLEWKSSGSGLENRY
jgi:hypothetical protein